MKKYMKLPVLLLSGVLMVFLFFSCGSSTSITGTWERQDVQKEFNNVLVAALTPNTGLKSTIERHMEQNLQQEGIVASQSINVLPPKFSDDEDQKQKILNTIQSNGFDGILTVSIIEKDTESRYVPGSASYAPYPSYGYYGSFWGYYSHWYPQFYSPGYYTEENVYYIETNLYNAQTEDLVWSAQSETYNPRDLETFSEDFAEEVVEQLAEDGII